MSPGEGFHPSWSANTWLRRPAGGLVLLGDPALVPGPIAHLWSQRCHPRPQDDDFGAPPHSRTQQRIWRAATTDFIFAHMFSLPVRSRSEGMDRLHLGHIQRTQWPMNKSSLASLSPTIRAPRFRPRRTSAAAGANLILRCADDPLHFGIFAKRVVQPLIAMAMAPWMAPWIVFPSDSSKETTSPLVPPEACDDYA